jgi:hypothetical protein
MAFLSRKFRPHFSQIAIAIVIFLNLQCAILFLFSPLQYAFAFELTGVPGDTAIRGFGILFIMWNVPYVVALINPLRHRMSYMQAVVMQSIGFIGESFLLFTIPSAYYVLQSSIQRFILFDGIGLILLIAGYWSLPKITD